MQPTERHSLIAAHVEMAARIALKMARRCPDHVAREDLISAGLLGLTDAANRYDASRGDSFIPFAALRIRGAVLDEMRRSDLLPRRVRQMARKIAVAIRHLETDGESATDARVATSLGVTVESYRDNLAMLPRSGTVSIEGEDAPLLVDPEQSPRELAARRQLLARVRVAIDLLDKRDATLLGLRYIEDLSVQEVATTLGISSSRVCQLVTRALGRLQDKLGVTMQKAAA